MHRIVRLWTAVLIVVASPALSQDGTAEVDPRYVWDLSELYPTPEAWSQAREDVLADLDGIEGLKGTLGNGSGALLEAFSRVSDATRQAARVSAYASLAADEDLRESSTQERRQLSQILFTRLNEKTAWMQPELLRVGEETIESFLAEEPRLERFAFQLRDSLRNAPHTLGDEAEAALSYLTPVNGAPQNIYSVVANSDIPWPTIELSTGEEHRIDSQGYARWRASPNRDDRKLVFDTFWNKWLEYRNTRRRRC